MNSDQSMQDSPIPVKQSQNINMAAAEASRPHRTTDMQLITRMRSSYDHLKVLGDGAYGTVYLGRNRIDNSYVALKQIKFHDTDDGVPVSAVREISMLRHLEKFNHPNIVKLLDVSHATRLSDKTMSLSLVFEYVDFDLYKYMHLNRPLPPQRIKSLMHQTMCAIDFLHTHRVVHRDMKPQNILVTKNHQVKLADFGLSRICDFYMKFTTVVVTLWYRAPELLLAREYATPVDVWSCGCIFAELFKGRPLFEGTTEIDQVQKIFSILELPTQEDWQSDIKLESINKYKRRSWTEAVSAAPPDAIDLLTKLLAFKPTERLTAYDALSHPYFRGMHVPTFSMTALSFGDPVIPPSSGIEAVRIARNTEIAGSSASSRPAQNEAGPSKRLLEHDDQSKNGESSSKRQKNSHGKYSCDYDQDEASVGTHQSPSCTKHEGGDNLSLECTESMPDTPAGTKGSFSCQESLPETPISSAAVTGLLMLGTTVSSSCIGCDETTPETPILGGSHSMFSKVQPKKSDPRLPQTNDENNPNAGNKASQESVPSTSGSNLTDQKISDVASSNSNKSPSCAESSQKAVPQ